MTFAFNFNLMPNPEYKLSAEVLSLCNGYEALKQPHACHSQT